MLSNGDSDPTNMAEARRLDSDSLLAILAALDQHLAGLSVFAQHGNRVLPFGKRVVDGTEQVNVDSVVFSLNAIVS